mmetsp:Transcript_40222/g.87745  ORF Transcript_40222/g.87745 Transcript_40222/m.87745 type:complete len:201 (+) Transcript_40222:301-903(+)
MTSAAAGLDTTTLTVMVWKPGGTDSSTAKKPRRSISPFAFDTTVSTPTPASAASFLNVICRELHNPARTNSTGLGPVSVPPRSVGSSTTCSCSPTRATVFNPSVSIDMDERVLCPSTFAATTFLRCWTATARSACGSDPALSSQSTLTTTFTLLENMSNTGQWASTACCNCFRSANPAALETSTWVLTAVNPDGSGLSIP